MAARWFVLSFIIAAVSIGGWYESTRSLSLGRVTTHARRPVAYHGGPGGSDGMTSDDTPPQNDTTAGEPTNRNRNLVAFNAVGRRHNLALVEHTRRHAFPPTAWDCVAFMYATEEDVPPDDGHLRSIANELGCDVVRTPGLMWGTFLQFLVPGYVKHYNYIAIVLDDMFVPHVGDGAVDTAKLIDNMQRHGVDVIQPGIVGDTFGSIEVSRENGMDGCLTEVRMIETYVQIFSATAWECYYRMLHHSGGRGWGYALCIKKMCPSLKLGQDFSMRAWHMDRGREELPAQLVKILDGGELMDWKLDAKIKSQGYYETPGSAILKRYKCWMKNETRREIISNHMSKIKCPASLHSKDSGNTELLTLDEILDSLHFSNNDDSGSDGAGR